MPFARLLKMTKSSAENTARGASAQWAVDTGPQRLPVLVGVQLFSAELHMSSGLSVPVKCGTSALHKCTRRGDLGPALTYMEELLLGIEGTSTDSAGCNPHAKGLFTNIVNRWICALLEDGPLLFAKEQPQFTEPLFRHLNAIVIAFKKPETDPGFVVCRKLMRCIVQNLKQIKHQGRYLSYAAMLVRTEKLPRAGYERMYAEMNPSARAHAKRKNGFNEFERLLPAFPGFHTLLQTKGILQNKELNKLLQDFVNVFPHFQLALH